MEQEQWKYQIGSGKMPVALMFIMTALFSGLTFWMYKTNNGAILFSGILTIVMMLVFILTIYRFIFYKVLIGANGFYYQTGIGNGKYYDYNDVEKAWISSGTAQNGGQEQYCNIAVYNENVIRFQFFYSDEKGVKYLVKQVSDTNRKRIATNVKEKEEYLIDGKAFGKIKIGIGITIFVIFALLDISLIKTVGFTFILIPSIAMEIATVCAVCNNYLFFQVKIQKDGFYCRTNPFNGTYYKYSDVTACREIKKVVRHRQHFWNAATARYYFFFEFTDVSGKKQKFSFEKEIYEKEIDVLKERISNFR